MVRPELPYQDHYEIARNAGVDRLRAGFDTRRLEQLGAALIGDSIGLDVLCWQFRLTLEPFSMVLLPGGQEVSIVWQILVLDYLSGHPGSSPGRFVSFADFPDARGYLPTFDKRVIQRLSFGVARNPEEFVRRAEQCAGARGSDVPLTYLFRLFPKLELQVIRHEGDEDLPPSCNILFPDNALDLLTAECMVAAAERLASALEGKGPARG